jgi:hypothetical protein
MNFSAELVKQARIGLRPEGPRKFKIPGSKLKEKGGLAHIEL